MVTVKCMGITAPYERLTSVQLAFYKTLACIPQIILSMMQVPLAGL